MSPPPRLPDELILRILSHDSPQSLVTIRHASKQLKRCAEETILRILPNITLSTIEFSLPYLEKTNYRFASVSSDPANTPCGNVNLVRANARFKASEHRLKYDPSVKWSIGWSVEYDGDYAVSGLGVERQHHLLVSDEKLQVDFTIYDILTNVPEVGSGPWAGEGTHITAT